MRRAASTSLLLLFACLEAGGNVGALAATEPPSDLAGPWTVILTARGVDDFTLRMTMARAGDGRFEAYSTPGALRPFHSWPKYVVGKVTGRLPPHLAAITIRDLVATPAGDSARVMATLSSPMLGTYRVSGILRGDSIRAELRTDSAGPVVGRLRAHRGVAARPLRDYRAVARSIADTMAAYLYDPRLMRDPRWAGFFEELEARFSNAGDDADALAAFYALRPRLESSHIDLTFSPRLAAMSVDSALNAVSAPPESLVTLGFSAPGVAILSIRRWEKVSAVVDRAFQRIDSAGVHTLIVDIRSNTGGDQSSIALAGHLIRDTVEVGALIANRWYRQHDSAPTARQMRSLPRASESDLLATFHTLRKEGVAVSRVSPRSPRFTGKVFLLTNRWSGSASEPLAYFLRHLDLATLVGERTPGAMLAAVPHPVGFGWVLVLPEADFRTADGVRLEGRGVTPDVGVRWEDAMFVVADSLRRKSPYAAALIAAIGGRQGLTPANRDERLRISERWAREALRHGPDSAAAITSLGSTLFLAKRWDAGFAIWDSLLRADSTRTAAHYQLGRFAASSATRLEDGEVALRRYLGTPVPRGAPSHASAYFQLGRIRELRGDTAGARSAYRSGLDLEPGNADLRAALKKTG